MKPLYTTLFLLFTILLVSCGDFQEVTFSGIESVRVIKMSQQGVEAELHVKINNPNNTAFHIYPTSMDATLNGINAGKAVLTNNVRIHAHSEEVYTFNIKSDFSGVSMTDLPKIISMAMSKTVKIGLKGNLKVGKFLVRKKYPIDFSKSVPVNGFINQ